MSYVDGFIAAVPTANKEAYIAHAELAAQVFKDHGAVQVVDCWGEDVPDGEVTSLPMAVKCEAHETVCFSWVVWPSKHLREIGMEKAMQDPRLLDETNPMPFDGQRMIFGGFDVIVDV